MKVIVAIDGSPHSERALELVTRMTWPTRTQFIVLSAVPQEVMAYTMVDASAASAVQEIEQKEITSHDGLAALGVIELASAGLQGMKRVELGDPRDIIVRVAQVEGADLVVVGSHGRTGLSRLVMGSVASHVVAHAPCSVLVVKSPKPSCRNPF